MPLETSQSSLRPFFGDGFKEGMESKYNDEKA
jgi:hypothetical protein